MTHKRGVNSENLAKMAPADRGHIHFVIILRSVKCLLGYNCVETQKNIIREFFI